MRRGAGSGAAALVLLAAIAWGPARADRLHLESGGYVDTPRWWVEGDTLVYESDGGTIGVPRSMVVRIETGAARGPERRPSFNQSAPTRTSRPSAGALDDAEIREQLARAHEALERRDYELASSYYLSILRSAPELYVARAGYALSEMAVGRDGLALSAVLDGLNLDPDRPELHELLGELRYREERLEDALRSWRRAFALAPSDRLRDKIVRAERELHASRDFDFAASSHFNVRYDGEVDVELATAVLDHLEERYWALTELYRHTPPQPITVQLYPRRAFRDVTQTAEWVGGLYDGKIRVPLGGLSRLSPDARRVLTHELTHAIVHSKTRGHAPRWLHEGLAQIAEGKRLTRGDAERLAAELRERPRSAWHELALSYASALSQVRYLESRRGHDGLVTLLDLLAEGGELDPSLRRVYGQTYAELCRSWGDAVLGEAD